MTPVARASSLMQRGPQSSSQIALSFVGLFDAERTEMVSAPVDLTGREGAHSHKGEVMTFIDTVPEQEATGPLQGRAVPP